MNDLQRELEIKLGVDNISSTIVMGDFNIALSANLDIISGTPHPKNICDSFNVSINFKFLLQFHLGRSKEERDDFELRSAIVHHFSLEYGSRLTENLIKAAIFYLPTYTYQDIGDILLELMLLDRTSVCHWLESAIRSLPQDENQPRATQAQLVKFHRAVTSAEENHQVTEAVREFCRLWR